MIAISSANKGSRGTKGSVLVRKRRLARSVYRLRLRQVPSLLAALDERSLDWISNSPLLARLERVFVAATYLGDGVLWGGLALPLMFLGERNRRYVLIGLGITIINVVIYTLIKLYFKRERPIPFPVPLRSWVLERYSFPSGHAAVAFGIALIVAHFYPILWAQVGIYFLAGFISLSRIYVREHYPSDVIAGALLGTLITGALLPIFTRIFLQG